MLRFLKSHRQRLWPSPEHRPKDRSKIWPITTELPEQKNHSDSIIWWLIGLDNQAGCDEAHSQAGMDALAAFASQDHKIILCAYGDFPYESGKPASIRSESCLVVEKGPECKSVRTKPSAETASMASSKGILVYQVGNEEPTIRDERRDGRIYTTSSASLTGDGKAEVEKSGRTGAPQVRHRKGCF